MTDKVQLIREEIERQIEKEKVKCQQSQENNDYESFVAWSEHIATCGKLLVFINSLSEEPASEDLEEEIENYIKDSLAIKFPTIDKEQIKTDIRYIARHFAEWQKQQMMKDAVDATIVNDWQYGKDQDHAVIPAIHQRIDGFNVGDKVKIIIVKEKQQ